MIHRFILHNDAIREASERMLSPGQVGLLSGWGVFSTLRVVEGVLFAFERHWARMARDAASLHVPMPDDPERVRNRLLELVEANGAQDSTMRLVIVRTSGGLWEGPSTGRTSDVIALTATSKEWGQGVKLCYTQHGRYAASQFASAKILSWAMNLTWLEAAQAKGFQETILLNERGEVVECTSANIFVANGGRVCTPPLTSGCLPGITRELLLGEIRVPGIGIEEQLLMPEDLELADEVFITSTTRDLLPVLQIEDRPAGDRSHARPALSSAFAEYMDRYVAEHKRAAPAHR